VVQLAILLALGYGLGHALWRRHREATAVPPSMSAPAITSA
jgi:hypothetical protein